MICKQMGRSPDWMPDILLRADGYETISGPRTTGDGYYEACVLGFEDNQIEITI